MRDFEIRTSAMRGAARDEAWTKMIRAGGFAETYLYFRKSTETADGEIRVFLDGEEIPDGFELAWQERLPCDRTKQQLFQWIEQRTGRIPILAWGDNR